MRRIGGNKVDWCETTEGKKQAFKVNVEGTPNIRWMFKGRMILISTSYIFSGRSGPYDEDLWNKHKMPVNEYGFTKLAAECVFEQPGTIVRTVGLYGGERDDFAKTIIARASLGETVHAMRNLSFNPTYVPHLAAALLQLAEMKEPPAVVNVAGSEILSRSSSPYGYVKYSGWIRNW